MSGQIWTPPNIAAICPEQQAQLTQCSTTGYLFLALISQLYGGSKDNQKMDLITSWEITSERKPSTVSPYFDEHELFKGPGVFQTKNPQIKQPSEPPLLNQEDFFSEKLIGPGVSSTKVLSHGPGGSQGISQFSSYFPTFEFEKFSKTYNPELEHEEFGYESYNKVPVNPVDGSFAKPFLNRDSKYHSRDVNFDFESIFTDSETANTEKVAVNTEKKSRSKRRRKRQATERFDFIVVGAGSAGCVIANRLSEVKQWKVLLIEAGPEEPDVTSVPAFAPVLGRSSIDWNYRTQPEEMTCRAQRGQTCAWLSGRVMGGSSSINYVVYMRGNKNDYDHWADLGNEGWSYDEVLHYFKKSEDNQNVEAKDKTHHGTGGPLNVERFAYTDPNVIMLVKAFREKGFPLVDFNGKTQIGTMTTQTTTKDGRRVSSNDAFIRPIRSKRPNLTVMTNSQVIKILIHKDKYAYGVVFVQNSMVQKVRADKEVIISAGALNSPKLLMLSGIGPKEDLENLEIPVIMDLKVGYNLQDHVTTEAVLMELSNETSTSLPGNEMLKDITNFHKYGSSYDQISATGPLQVTAFYRTTYADDDKLIPDVQFHFDGRKKSDFYKDPSIYLATNIFPLTYYDSINVRPILLQPESRGYLTLNKTHPTLGQPLIYPGFFTMKRDLKTLVAALKFAAKLEETNAFKENNVRFIRKRIPPCKAHTWGSNRYFSCIIQSYTGTIYHPAGTCKMGPSFDENAVVDARLRVYGVQNLRVADASIMPRIVRGNTNAPCMMIGEKVSDMIKEDWDSVYWET